MTVSKGIKPNGFGEQPIPISSMTSMLDMLLESRWEINWRTPAAALHTNAWPNFDGGS